MSSGTLGMTRVIPLSTVGPEYLVEQKVQISIWSKFTCQKTLLVFGRTLLVFGRNF